MDCFFSNHTVTIIAYGGFPMKKHWLWVITFLWICFIFGNSLMNAEISGNTSGNLSKILFDLILKTGITVTFDAFHHFIRKLAHFTEYFILAMLVCLSMKYQPLPVGQKTCFFCFMILTPCLDESIQHFVPGRYGAFSDCLLDMSGYCTGALILWCLYGLGRKLFSR